MSLLGRSGSPRFSNAMLGTGWVGSGSVAALPARRPLSMLRPADRASIRRCPSHLALGLGMNPDSLVIETFDAAPEPLLQAVDQGLDEHNVSVAPLQDVSPLSAIARAAEGQVLGGAVGRTWGACCELLQLWVSKGQRSRGLGTRLLHAFERAARSRGCTVFYLTTLSYQAPDFYKKHGYAVAAEIAGYPDGIRKFLMLRTERSG